MLQSGMQQVSIAFLLLFGLLATVNAVPFYNDLFRQYTPLTQQNHRLYTPLDPLTPQTQHLLIQNVQPHFFRDYFGGGTEFVPLEAQTTQQVQQPQARDAVETVTPVRSTERPFDVDVITSDVNGGSVPNVFFQQSFPFLGQDFFNSFGGFGIGAGPNQEPWWKGPNVCTDKTEEEDVATVKDEKEQTEELVSDSTDIIKTPLFGQFQFSLNSCVEKPNKYVCSRIINQNGKKKTLRITRQCCHGYARARNADFTTQCEKVEIKNIEGAAADMGASEFAKSNGADEALKNIKNVTIFMPMDEAFKSYNEQSHNENHIDEAGANKKLFARHIVDGEVSLYDATNEQILKTQDPEQTIRINAYQLPPTVGSEPYRYTANCVPIQKHDKVSEAGLVHAIAGVMKPVAKNVMEIIRQRADLSIMRTVLEKTKVSEMLEGEKPVTIFVPTDDAFDELNPELRRLLKEGKGCATNVLRNHILDLTFCTVASLPGVKTSAYNLLGEQLRFNRSKPANEKSEVADLLQEQPVLINGIAKITDADLMAANGVVHVIDAVLPTETALPLSGLMQQKNVTLFRQLIEASGLIEKFDDLSNITLFAPTDKALRGTKWANLLEHSPDQLQNNEELIEFLHNHVVRPMTKTCDLKEQLMPTAGGQNVRINLYSTHALFSNVMNRATVNCARLVHFDDESCDSVLHQVDKVLTPARKTLLEYLESEPQYSRFLALVRSANLTSALSDTDSGLTLLVPKNEVFEEVDEWEKTLTKNQQDLENLVKTHIVKDVVCCAGIIPTQWPFVRSIESLNGAHLRITRDRRPKIENAGVTKCDGIATNGIVHEINDIIVPARRQANRSPYAGDSAHGADSFSDLFF